MKKLIFSIVVMLFMSPAVDSRDLRALFPYLAEVETGPPGLQRVALSPELLKQCRADLSDLRIIDASGREIPFILSSPPPEGTSLKLRHRITPKILSVDRRRSAQDRQNSGNVEDFMLEIPGLPEKIDGWELVLDISRPEFVARVDIAVVEPDGSRKMLLSGDSVFRLPSSGISRTAISLGSLKEGRLNVVLQGQNQGYLSPSFRLAASRTLRSGAGEGVGLEILSREETSRGTEVLLKRPRGIIPRKLAFECATPTFKRKISVWDEGAGAGEKVLSEEQILRIQAIVPVESLEIPLSPARGEFLRVIIENQDSPPLEDLRVHALLRRPVLIFSTTAEQASFNLYFGGGRAGAPFYDIAGLKKSIRKETPATDTLLAILDPGQSHVANLGEISKNPSWDDTPALAFAAHPGAELDGRGFRYRRRLEIRPSKEGLARIPLETDDLSRLRPDLGDLRIVDSEGFQWAYLRQDHNRVVEIPLKIPDASTHKGVSRYSFDIPGLPLYPMRLRLESPAPFFDRDLICYGLRDGGHEVRLWEGRIRRRAGDPRPIFLEIDNRGYEKLRIDISDGDDAPLHFSSLRATVRAPDLYLPARAGSYELLLGNPDAGLPSYEIGRIRSMILALPAAQAELAPLEENPSYSAAHRFANSGSRQKILLWAILILAVLLLAGLTLRSARSISRDEGPPEG